MGKSSLASPLDTKDHVGGKSGRASMGISGLRVKSTPSWPGRPRLRALTALNFHAMVYCSKEEARVKGAFR